MSGPAFKLKIITPGGISEKEISYVRLKDHSGYFGIMKGHIDFVTILEPALCYYENEAGGRVFLAVNGGLLRVNSGKATLASREIYESEDAEKLAPLIENEMGKRNRSEASFREMLKQMERSFLEKTLQSVRR